MGTKDWILDRLSTVNRDGMDDLIRYLEESDFFTAPASRSNHGNHEGGLAEHSFNVWKALGNKNVDYELRLPDETLIITSLLHDICKVNYYDKEQKWRKDDKGRWQDYYPYVIKDQMPLGHGEKSVMILQRFIHLTDQETMMIRWHMALAEPKDSYWTMNKAMDMYPEIVVLHCADFEASRFLDKKVEV